VLHADETTLQVLRESGKKAQVKIEWKLTSLDPFRYLAWGLKTSPTLNQIMDSWLGLLLPSNASTTCHDPDKF